MKITNILELPLTEYDQNLIPDHSCVKAVSGNRPIWVSHGFGPPEPKGPGEIAGSAPTASSALGTSRVAHKDVQAAGNGRAGEQGQICLSAHGNRPEGLNEYPTLRLASGLDAQRVYQGGKWA
jgi:hypothetical protein